MISTILAWAALTEYHRLWGLNNRISHSSGTWKSQLRVPAGSAPDDSSLLGLQTATFSVSSRGLSFLCALGKKDPSLFVLIMPPIL